MSGRLCFFAALFTMTTHMALGESLDEYLKYAAGHNPELNAAFESWQAERNTAAQRGALPDPSISYAHYFEEVETRVGPQERRFGISQKFPAFGKRGLRRSVAEESAGMAESAYRERGLKLNYEVVSAYADLYLLKRRLNISKEHMILVEQLESAVSARYRSGAPLAPLTRIQVELGRLEDRVRSLEQMRRPLQVRMNVLLGRPPQTPVPDPASLPSVSIPDRNALLVAAFESNPKLEQFRHLSEQARLQQSLARREWLPDIMLELQYIDTGDASMQVRESGKDPVIGMVSLNLPLWFGKKNAAVREAAYRGHAAQFALENRRQLLVSELEQTLFELDDARRKIGLYRDTLIPKARESFLVTRQAYEAGSEEFAALTDATRQLLEFKLAYEEALAGQLKMQAKLSMQSGIDFTDFENEVNHEAED